MAADREGDTMAATDRRERERERTTTMSETTNTPTEPYHCEHTEHVTRGDGRYGRHFETADPAGAWEPCPSPPVSAPDADEWEALSECIAVAVDAVTRLRVAMDAILAALGFTVADEGKEDE